MADEAKKAGLRNHLVGRAELGLRRRAPKNRCLLDVHYSRHAPFAFSIFFRPCTCTPRAYARFASARDVSYS